MANRKNRINNRNQSISSGGSIDDQIAMLQIQKMQYLEKALRSADPSEVLRANDEISKLMGTSPKNQKSYTFDPFTSSGSNGYKEQNSQLSFEYLRAMARTPLIRSVIDTRQNQVSKFSKPTIDNGTAGWTIRKKRSVFETEEAEPTKEEMKEMEAIMKFISDCGMVSSDEYSVFDRGTFDGFMRMFTRDSLTLDQSTFECVPTRGGKLAQFVTTDSATFRYADEASYKDSDGNYRKEAMEHGQIPKYVQIYNKRPVADFYSWELAFGVRNMSTDIHSNGYGVSELEDLSKIVTWMLFGDSYNGRFFSQGASPKGILKVSGNVNQDRLSEFRTYWKQMVTGYENAWRTPVLESDKVEWIDLQKSNQDMQFGAWQEYLIRVLCAVFKIDPTEMGFLMMQNSGGGGGMYTSHQQRVDYSKDKGLIPLLKFLEEFINKFIVGRLSQKYEFLFTGIAPDDESAMTDIDVKRIGAWMTVNEVRAKYKLKPLPDGDIILNSIYLQSTMASKAGDPDSNKYVEDEEEDDDSNDNELENKSAWDELNKWIEAGMPPTIKQIDNGRN